MIAGHLLTLRTGQRRETGLRRHVGASVIAMLHFTNESTLQEHPAHDREGRAGLLKTRVLALPANPESARQRLREARPFAVLVARIHHICRMLGHVRGSFQLRARVRDACNVAGPLSTPQGSTGLWRVNRISMLLVTIFSSLSDGEHASIQCLVCEA